VSWKKSSLGRVNHNQKNFLVIFWKVPKYREEICRITFCILITDFDVFLLWNSVKNESINFVIIFHSLFSLHRSVSQILTPDEQE